MTLSLILLALSITGSLLTYFLTGIYQDIAFLWLPFVLIIAYFVGLLLAQSFITFFIALFVNVKKEQKKPNPFFNFEIRNISQVFLKMCLIKVHVKGKELLPEKKKNNAFVAVTNHISNFDHLVTMQVFHRYKVVSISKPEMEKVPSIGGVQHKAGFITIDRDNAMRAMKAVRKSINFIKNDYASITIAPEGTRSKDGLLKEFHPMTFMIATNSKCPLVVVSIKNTDKVKKNFPFRITHVYVNIVKVFYPEDYENMSTKDLAQLSHDLIAKDLGQM